MASMEGIYIAKVRKNETYFHLTLKYMIKENKFVDIETNRNEYLGYNNFLTVQFHYRNKNNVTKKNWDLLENNKFVVVDISKKYFKMSNIFSNRTDKDLDEIIISALDENNIFQIVDCSRNIYNFDEFKNSISYKLLYIDKPYTKHIYIKYKNRIYGKFMYDYYNNGALLKYYPNKESLKIYEYGTNIIRLREDATSNKEYEFVFMDKTGNYKEIKEVDEIIERMKDSLSNSSNAPKKEEPIDNEKSIDEIITYILDSEEKRKVIYEEIIANYSDKLSENIKQEIIKKEEELNQLQENVENTKKTLDDVNKDIILAKKQYTKSLGEYEVNLKNKEAMLSEINSEIQAKENEYTVKFEPIKKQIGEGESMIDQINKRIEAKRIEYKKISKIYENDINIKKEELLKIEERVKVEKENLDNLKNKKEELTRDSSSENIKNSLQYENKLLKIREGILARENKKIENRGQKQFINYIRKFINNESGRDISYNEVANILICISQGFLTIFAGEPGSGKTSLCNLLAKSLGLNIKGENNRFIEVSVEKGWESKSDLIGYYNPITKSFDSANSKVFEALTILNEENKLKRENQSFDELPYLILLDEANLSPMEHYWADFMNVCDIDMEQEHEINLGGDNIYDVSNCLRFLATINYDHTTEVLSPRLIDRSWIILLENKKLDIDKLINKKVLNNNKIVDFEIMKGFINTDNNPMPEIIKTRLEEIIEALESVGIDTSIRVQKMIKNYCAIGELVFEKDEGKELVVLDYAVAQKILPNIKGFNEGFKEFLVKFKDENLAGMEKSQRIVEKMIKMGEKNMNYYQFFSR